ncbi:MAG TPA: septum formation initiator family protein [Candidatus Acidoferrales bacterium]|jgi:cell division protein FtsB|nr:septum formation initiator family protein [Candidatus Acidoferrales bacterium]
MRLKEIRAISTTDVLAYAKKNTRQILALALFALFVHDIFGPHGFLAMRRTQKEIEQIHDQIVKMNEQNKALTDQVSSLKSDPKSIERIAREEMGLARPGEMIFKVPDSPKASSK